MTKAQTRIVTACRLFALFLLTYAGVYRDRRWALALLLVLLVLTQEQTAWWTRRQ